MSDKPLGKLQQKIEEAKKLHGSIKSDKQLNCFIIMPFSGAVFEDADEKQEYIDKKEEEYTQKFANPYEAAKYGFIDDVIEPRNTRFRIIRALQLLQNKKEVNPPKKHSNIPL